MTFKKEILNEIEIEIEKQDVRWGADRDHPSILWNTILAEEVGEVARGILEHDLPNTREELLQVAGICAQMINAIDRNEFKR